MGSARKTAGQPYASGAGPCLDAARIRSPVSTDLEDSFDAMDAALLTLFTNAALAAVANAERYRTARELATQLIATTLAGD